jgi:rubrerythrin
MIELKGTNTEKNLREIFCEEPQPPDRYTFLEKEGYDKIAAYFSKINSIKENPENRFRKFDSLGKPIDYFNMAKEAREEGFEEIAQIFEWLSECLTISDTK